MPNPPRNGRPDEPLAGTSEEAFVAAIGHRLREPLNVLSGALPQLRSSADAARDRALGVVDRAIAAEADVVSEVEWLLHAVKARAGSPAAAANADRPGTSNARARLPRLLIVDDACDAVEMWAFFFRSAGYDVLTATTGRRAITAARRGLPDVVLLDLQLPDLSGLDVAERLRADPRTAGIPLLAVTGFSGKAHQDAARKAGFTAMMVKPCHPDDLLRKVESLMNAAASQSA
jgi:CheY-like chemotaxis protein